MNEENLKEAFGAIWVRFLEFEITRSRLMCEVGGNPLSALILQVVAYHKLTLVRSAVKSESYNEILSAWIKHDEQSLGDLPLKLTFASISDITGIDKETVRRSVKKLEEQGWLNTDRQTGIHYNPTQSNQDKLLMLNEWEIGQLGRLLNRLNTSTTERKKKSTKTEV